MKPHVWIMLGALLGGLAVAAGALGAHGLQDRLSTRDLQTFEVAVRYQIYHSLALVLVGLLGSTGTLRGTFAAGVCFLTGILLFSGMLYLYLFSGTKMFALIVPLGGVMFIVGWLALAASAWRSRRASATG